MNTHCPECGVKYSDPQPSDYVCRDCLFKFALEAIVGTKRPIVLIDEGDIDERQDM